MAMIRSLLLTASILSTLMLLLPVDAQTPTETCTMTQHCNEAGCPNPTNISNPIISFFEPKVVGNPFGLMQICPFLDASQPLCCNDDQIAIMTHNYQQIDSVFGKDCPLCALNLKKLWCMYTCGPQKVEYVTGLGYKEIGSGEERKNFTEVYFSVDEDMACTIFQSCKKVSLIAQASVQSSIAFLDFLVGNIRYLIFILGC